MPPEYVKEDYEKLREEFNEKLLFYLTTQSYLCFSSLIIYEIHPPLREPGR